MTFRDAIYCNLSFNFHQLARIVAYMFRLANASASLDDSPSKFVATVSQCHMQNIL